MLSNFEQLHKAYGHHEPRKNAFLDPSLISATSVDDSVNSFDDWGEDLSDILAEIKGTKRTAIARTKSFDPSRKTNKTKRDTPRRSVSFGKVQIRSYERVLADSVPTCSPGGPALGLGWNFVEKKAVEVDKHEKKGSSIFAFTKARRQKKDFLLSAEKRLKMAEKLGFTEEEIVQNSKQCDRVVKQRNRSIQQYMEQQMDPFFLMQTARRAHFGRS